MRRKDRKGFTLIELLAVIVILSLLFGLAYPAISRYINETRNTTYETYEKNMEDSTKNMMSDCLKKDVENCLPTNGGSRKVTLSELITKGYSNTLTDPANDSIKCDEYKSYVVATNSNDNVAKLSYDVCLVCSNYKSKFCDEASRIPQFDCNAGKDKENPECGTINGASTLWTNKDRVITVGCSDDCTGCEKDSYSVRFSETTKTSSIEIKDKAGKTTNCPVNVYVDKNKPTCKLKITGNYNSETGWYGGSAPVVTWDYKTDGEGESGLSTFGLGVSKNDIYFFEDESYTVAPGISTIYGYVKDKAGNIGTCSVEIKYDSDKPVIKSVDYGYRVYVKEDISNKSTNKVILNNITSEYGNVYGAYVYFNNGVAGNIKVREANNLLKTITTSAGVKSYKVLFDSGKYSALSFEFNSDNQANDVSRIELLTDNTNGFYTNKDVTMYINSSDSLSGKAEYSFDNGSTWSTNNSKTYSTNQTGLKLMTRDRAKNVSDASDKTIPNIDKLVPNATIYTPNSKDYTITVGNTNLNVSSKITITDQDANTNYAKSTIRSISYAWSTSNTTEPTSWTSTTNNSTLTQNSTGGNYYLWTKAVDKAGNVKISTSGNHNTGYQVTYDCNGGSGCPTDQRKVYNTDLTLTNTKPTRTNYVFVGWGTTNNTHTASYQPNGKYTDNKAIKLYAIWKRTLSFTFEANGASLSKTSTSCDIYNAETSCNITLPTITRSGFTIIGFSTSSTGHTVSTTGWTSGATVSVTASTTNKWYAVTSKTVTITYNKNNASAIGKTSDSCTIWNSNTTCSITSPTITAPTNTPTVIGWNTSSSATTSSWGVSTAKSFSASATYYAITRKNAVIFTITYNKNNAKAIGKTSDTCTINATYNGTAQDTTCTFTTTSITAPTNTPTVVGWNTSSTGQTSTCNASASCTINSNKTFYAITMKSAVTRSIIYNKNGGSGTMSNTTCTIAATYNGTAQGTTCNATIASNTYTRTGYNFDGWYTAASGGSSKSGQQTLSSDLTVYAHWKEACGALSMSGYATTGNNGGSCWVDMCDGSRRCQDADLKFTISGCVNGLSGKMCYWNPEGTGSPTEDCWYAQGNYSKGSTSYHAGNMCFYSEREWHYYRSTEYGYAYACNSAGQCGSKSVCTRNNC